MKRRLIVLSTLLSLIGHFAITEAAMRHARQRSRTALCETTYEERDLGPNSVPRFVQEARCDGHCLSGVGQCAPVLSSDHIYRMDANQKIDRKNFVRRQRAVACVCMVPRTFLTGK
uniref:Uncharacterized protein n=1 Tax=Plectus sambesii TaxID=2011161 RepID=A0A914V8P3_9BILA